MLVSLTVAIVGGGVTAISRSVALLAGGLPALGALSYGLFLNPPA